MSSLVCLHLWLCRLQRWVCSRPHHRVSLVHLFWHWSKMLLQRAEGLILINWALLYQFLAPFVLLVDELLIINRSICRVVILNSLLVSPVFLLPTIWEVDVICGGEWLTHYFLAFPLEFIAWVTCDACLGLLLLRLLWNLWLFPFEMLRHSSSSIRFTLKWNWFLILKERWAACAAFDECLLDVLSSELWLCNLQLLSYLGHFHVNC